MEWQAELQTNLQMELQDTSHQEHDIPNDVQHDPDSLTTEQNIAPSITTLDHLD